MSDIKLRALERQWHESGAAEDEAAFLRERIRVGDLMRNRLELAACVGHRAACIALGRPVPPVPLQSLNDEQIVLANGTEASARVSLALAEFALGHCDLPLVDDYPDRDGFRLLFFFAEAHLFNELPGNHEDRLSALTAVKAWGLAHGQVAAERGPSLGATLLSISAISLGMWPDVDKTKWGDGLARALGKAAKLLKDTPATIQALAVAALTETIAPWALGRADPLHMPERVRERAACAAQAAVSPHGASPQQPLSGSR